jgi:hypothetical protein
MVIGWINLATNFPNSPINVLKEDTKDAFDLVLETHGRFMLNKY